MGAKYASRVLWFRYLTIPILLLMCPHLVLAVNPFSVWKITDNAADDSSVQLNNNGWMAWSGSAGINLWDRAATQVLPSSAGNPLLADNGHVAWAANNDIWRWDGNTTQQVNTTTDSCSRPAINAHGDVAYMINKASDELGSSWGTAPSVPVANDYALISSIAINSQREWVYRYADQDYGGIWGPYGDWILRTDSTIIASKFQGGPTTFDTNEQGGVLYKYVDSQMNPTGDLYLWNGQESILIPGSTDGEQQRLNDNALAVWKSSAGISYWDSPATRVLPNSTGGTDPQINNRGDVVWRGENNNGIYYWNGQATVQVSDMQGVSAPQFNERNEIAWTASDGSDTEIYLASAYAPPDPDTTPPEGHLARPTGSSAKNAVVLVHGWNDSGALFTTPDGAPLQTDMKVNIEQALAANGRMGDWDVFVYDWSSDAESPGLPLPPSAEVKANALSHGQNLANELKEQGYDGDVHLIGHSLGSWVVHSATTALAQDSSRDGTIHDTFLDAYTPGPLGVSPNGIDISIAKEWYFGQDATWAEHYYHDEGGFDEFFANTDDQFWNAHNVDVTALIDQWDETTQQRHKWPVRWYDSTVGNNDPANEGYGFALSKEGSPDPDSWPPDLASFKQVSLAPPQLIDPVAAYLGASDTGFKDVQEGYIEMITASPVWVTLFVTTDADSNYLEFDYDFTSDADGVLSVFLEDELVGMFYERFSLDGEQGSGKLLFGELLEAGSYLLAFRVDPLTDDASSIRLSDVSLGHMSAVPEPSTMVMLIAGLIGFLAVRRRGIGR